MTHETTWRIVAVSAIALALLSAAALAIVFVVAFATVGEAVKKSHADSVLSSYTKGQGE